jgi:hypothetical protein
MKRALAVSNVLSWVNLVIGSFFGLCALLTILALPPIAVLISVVLIGCVILHSYAAIQLRKSMINPGIPLSKQTPVGIRMMGYMALFFAIMLFTNAIYLLQNTKELLKQMPLPQHVTEKDFINIVHGTAVCVLIFALSIIINVVLNFRLLKWYNISLENHHQD